MTVMENLAMTEIWRRRNVVPMQLGRINECTSSCNDGLILIFRSHFIHRS